MSERTGLHVDGVTVAPGDAIVLQGVTLDVPAQTTTALVGPSGAGKTTLLRAIAGLVELRSGTIVLDGRDLADVPTAKRRIGVVFQQPRLFPHLTVSENVAFGLRAGGVGTSERASRAKALLDQMGLAGFGDRKVTGLSGGEQQRVNLARALAIEPDLLLFDEPLSAVDPNRRAELRALIAELQRSRPTTALYITHDREEAAELGDALGVMLDGRIVQCGAPRELFERPASAFVAGFFGAENVLAPDDAAPLIGATPASTVVIRPEHVALAARGAAAIVTDIAYLGTHVRLTAQLGAAAVVAHVGSDVSAVVGATVHLAVRPEHVWALPSPSPTSDLGVTA